ncbi:ribonuclease P protein component [Agromyces aerolatus]|uniref:ribonuclease P protein component n=1 Tax=Agromyces sp. LY-1074 TaxID=3074080 RepID=UPI00286689DA|nr:MULTISPECIES: ribonuclease P protein component [unclassified Agromyces]MDR5699304.1 ribonuclease P protein component [Agromyces sp. LY-1074]MDR5705600.1 ribonuclease P protein component [Agromyces sp. LY-1358]
MLAKANRITSADDYRRVVRRGAKVAGAHTVSYVRSRESGTDARFGFIVSKKVGTAVRRNLVRRRLKAAGHEVIADGARGFDLVVRALPSAASAEFSSLRDEVRRAAVRGAALPPSRPVTPPEAAVSRRNVREEASGA